MTNTERAGTGDSPPSGTPAIIVGVDGSESSVNALREARRLAEALGSPLQSVAVWQQSHSMYDFYESETGWTPEESVAKLLRDTAQAAFGDDRPNGFTMTILQGAPTRSLIRHSAGAEMLVLGSRGHGGFTGLLLGSVSSACVAHALCPVLIVHNRDQIATDRTAPTAH
ncbi:nucleotide-binding universal stress UspA family protein [Mycetocola sp. CAN_C7]|uniref:universal stress protein n=1 Tax=Mycetocola sp. CAN_C7 TaxID=2787724 RepID=UPI0018CA0782